MKIDMGGSSIIAKKMQIIDLPIDSFRDIDTFLMPQDRLNLGRTCHEIRSHIATFMSHRSETLYLDNYGNVIVQTYIDATGQKRGFFVDRYDLYEQKFIKKANYDLSKNTYYSVYFYGNSQTVSNEGYLNFVNDHNLIDITNKNYQSGIYPLHVYIDRKNNLLAFFIDAKTIRYVQNVSYVRSDGNILEYICNDKQHVINKQHYIHTMNLYDHDCGEYRINFSTGDLGIFNDDGDLTALCVARSLTDIL